ncbi:MAG: hypothetical protein HOO86_11355 [Bacteroidales bacterium]|nr:hypothetical protein [Bacteroidales bacterium]
MTFRPVFIFALLFSTWISLSAQNKISDEQPGKWQIGGMLGYSQFFGDVSNKTYFQKFGGDLGFSIKAVARYHYNEFFGLGFTIHGGGMNSTKNNYSDGTAANLEISDRIFNFDAHGYLNISNLFWGSSSTRKVNIYSTLGLGFINWNGALTDAVTFDTVFINNRLRVSDSGFNKSAAYIPLALGLEFKLTNALSLVIEESIYNVLSDKVDFYKGGVGNDIISFTTVGLSYRFGQKNIIKNTKHTTIARPSEPVAVIDYDLFKTKQVQVNSNVPALTVTEPKINSFKAFEFRVQVLAKTSKVENIKRYFPNVVFDYEIRENSFGGIFRYSTGSFTTFKEAEAYSQTMRSRGIGDAFVVAYENNIRINITADMKKK